ncbi:MAG: hypothetical protein J3K34DRAFT_428872 [Monoraphidium minutum]|nr:MAG: hypothetical protein J3K34DRAFT_428872 [Monoraphidium minutum]
MWMYSCLYPLFSAPGLAAARPCCVRRPAVYARPPAAPRRALCPTGRSLPAARQPGGPVWGAFGVPRAPRPAVGAAACALGAPVCNPLARCARVRRTL